MGGGEDVGGEDPDEQERRTGEGVEEELGGGVAPPRAIAVDDEEVPRHQGDLEGHEEQKGVEGQEGRHAGGFQQEHPAQVGLRRSLPGGAGHGDREQQGRHGDEEERYAVDAQVPRDAERGQPGLMAGELETGVSVPGLEGDDHPQRDAKLDHRRANRQRPHGIAWCRLGQQSDHDGGAQGQEDDQVEDREAHGSVPDSEGEVGEQHD